MNEKSSKSLSARGMIMIRVARDNDLEGVKVIFFIIPLDAEFRGPILFPTTRANRGSADTYVSKMLGVKNIDYENAGS
ncbi:hypothetical protein DBO95_18185 [Yersinia pestis]|nr:hypothetical protein A8V49_04280 [Yersinia pestis]PVF12169.1 hypothetical protein DBO95_18185 [Yersinia pestis]